MHAHMPKFLLVASAVQDPVLASALRLRDHLSVKHGLLKTRKNNLHCHVIYTVGCLRTALNLTQSDSHGHAGA